MKVKSKKILTTLLVTAFTVSTMNCTTVFAMVDKFIPEKQGKKVLFETSFEDNEENKEFLETTIDNTKGSINVSGLEEPVFIDGSINNKIIKSSIKSCKSHNDNEIAQNLFDDSTNTKFLAYNGSAINESNPVWVSFEVKDKVKVDRYQIVSANDSPERDPKSWNLFGSNDGDEWTKIDSQTNQVFNKRFERKEYRIENP